MKRGRDTLAYDAFDSILQKPLYTTDGGVFPQFAVSAEGGELVDSTGQRYVDWVNGGGPVLLGHRRREVEEAIVEQLRAGPTLSLTHPLQLEVAEQLIEMVPCAERVAFGKNGSDSLAAAARLARAVTGRQVIVQYGMHGFHDWYVAHNPLVQGVPEPLRSLIQPFEYNDLAGLEALLERFEGQVAAVMMEPVRERLPEDGYLEAVRELTRRHGALWIWDEVVTALRLGNGGAQEVFGIEPDVACLGKALANGMPLSAVVGKREYMDRLPAVAFGMTFRGETLTLAAAKATLRVLREEPVAEHVARVGEMVRRGFDDACREHDLRIGLGGPPGRMTFVFPEDGGVKPDEQCSLFVQECLKRGVFTNGNILPSYAHDEAAVERTVVGLDGALAVMAEAIHAGRKHVLGAGRGPSPGPRAAIAIGYVEELRRAGSDLVVNGWSLLPDMAPNRVDAVATDGTVVEASVVERPDIVAAYPHVWNGARAGFSVVLPWQSCRSELLLRFWRLGRVAFVCRVVIGRWGEEENARGGGYWIGDGVIFA